jgi:thioredoxin-like negative regulator of GroEL
MAGIKSWAAFVAVASALALPLAARAEDDLAVQAIRNHDWATAEQQLQQGLQKNPGDLSRQLNLAWVYAQTGRKADAASLYQEILKHDQDRVASLPSSDRTSIAVLATRGLALLKKQ